MRIMPMKQASLSHFQALWVLSLKFVLAAWLSVSIMEASHVLQLVVNRRPKAIEMLRYQ